MDRRQGEILVKIKLLDENTFGIFNDSGVEVEKRSVTAEMRAAVTKKKSLTAVIKAALEAEGQQVADIPAEMVQTAEPVTVPFHEHPYDERAAEAAHEHEYQKIGEITPHKHDDFAVLGAALDGLDKVLKQEATHWSDLLTNHKHDQYAGQFHAHEDMYANLNTLARQVASLRDSIPTEAPAHQHNDFADAIAVLRSEITSLRQALDFERGKRVEDADRVQSFVKSEIEASRPQLDGFATKDDLANISLKTGTFRLKILSEQNVGGRRVLTVEELT